MSNDFDQTRFLLGRRKFLVIGAGAIGVSLLAACGADGGTGDRSASATGPSGPPQEGGTLIYGDVEDPPWTFKGATRCTASLMWTALGDNLISYDPVEDKYVPYLASAFEVNDTNTEFTFTIRDDVTFSDGTKLTPEVVKRNFDYHGFGDKELGVVPDAFYFGKYESATVSGNKVTVRLKSGYRHFLDVLIIPTSIIVADAYLKLSVKQQTSPDTIIASGPFLLDSYTAGEEIVLKKRPDYRWPAANDPNQGAAYLDKVKVRVVSELGLRAKALESKQVDIASRIQPTDETRLAKAGFDIHRDVARWSNDDNYSFKVNNPAVSDVRVRKALTIGIDREALSKYALSPTFTPGYSAIGYNTAEFIDFTEELKYDPDRANQLLDEAGWVKGADGIRTKDGKKLEIDIVTDNQGTATILAANYLVNEWRKNLGVVLIHHAGDNTYATSTASDPQVPALKSSRGPSSYAGFQTLYGSAESPSKTTYQYYPELNRLIEQDNELTDPAEIKENLQKMLQFILIDEVVSIPVFKSVQLKASAPYVHYELADDTETNLHAVWIKK